MTADFVYRCFRMNIKKARGQVSNRAFSILKRDKDLYAQAVFS